MSVDNRSLLVCVICVCKLQGYICQRSQHREQSRSRADRKKTTSIDWAWWPSGVEHVSNSSRHSLEDPDLNPPSGLPICTLPLCLTLTQQKISQNLGVMHYAQLQETNPGGLIQQSTRLQTERSGVRVPATHQVLGQISQFKWQRQGIQIMHLVTRIV